MVRRFVPEGSGDDQGDREETRGTEVRSTNSSCVLTRNIFTTNYSFCFDFFLLGAVSSNPPPPTRLLPVTLIELSSRPCDWGRMLATRQNEVQLLSSKFFTLQSSRQTGSTAC